MPLGDDLPIFVDICVFDETGRHLYTGPNCPHELDKDEMGPVIDQGWTVQNGKTN